MMHRHEIPVNHYGLDHGHGTCTEHDHWAGGTHREDTPLVVSTPENDPLGWREEYGAAQ